MKCEKGPKNSRRTRYNVKNEAITETFRQQKKLKVVLILENINITCNCAMW